MCSVVSVLVHNLSFFIKQMLLIVSNSGFPTHVYVFYCAPISTRAYYGGSLDPTKPFYVLSKVRFQIIQIYRTFHPLISGDFISTILCKKSIRIRGKKPPAHSWVSEVAID